jgi:elongation factor G
MAVLLEPVMRVEVVAHQQHLDAIVADLLERRGWIGSTEERSGMHVVCAFVPLSELFGYTSYLRDVTRGRSSFTMKLDRYEPVDNVD